MTKPSGTQNEATMPDEVKLPCSHLMHLPSGKCLGCGEQHQPLPDYQPGDDEAYLADEAIPRNNAPSDVVEIIGQIIEDELFPIFGAGPYEATAAKVAAALSASGNADVWQGKAIADIAAERHRQVEAEGWTQEHDDTHSDGALAVAAACYADPTPARFSDPRITTPIRWQQAIPEWDWNPKGRRSNLVRAGALIAAEIERLDRAALNAPPAEGEGSRTTLAGDTKG